MTDDSDWHDLVLFSPQIFITKQSTKRFVNGTFIMMFSTALRVCLKIIRYNRKRRNEIKTRIAITMISVLVCVLIAFPAPAQATAPEPLTIEADLYLTGANSAAGSFTASGLFTDAGAASEEFFTADGTTHGVKTLISTTGSITIKFQAQMTWTSPTTGFANGRFVIISGTGAYKNLHGVGETHAEIDLAAYHILASYTGTGHFN